MDAPLIGYEGSGTGSGQRWLIPDRQGSIIATTDATGAATTYAYDPYGQPTTWSLVGGARLPRFMYTGQAALPELRLYHYKARVYDPVIGRFLQTDPIGYEDDMNLYAYVRNDPINATDPTGMVACPEQPRPEITVDPAFGDGTAAVQSALNSVMATEHYGTMQEQNYTNDVAREVGPVVGITIAPGTRGNNISTTIGPDGRRSII